MKIIVNIDRLVLEGMRLTAREGALIRTAVEAELTRMFVSRGLRRGVQISGAVPRISGHEIPFLKEAPAQIGERIARSAYDGIAGLGRSPARSPRGGPR